MSKNFTLSEREYIERALKKKRSVKEIAAFLDKSKQAVYYEIKKGTVEQIEGSTLKPIRVYLSDYAHNKTQNNKKQSGAKAKYDPDIPLLKDALDLIRNQKYSPEAAVLKTGCNVCVKTLYNWIHNSVIDGLTVYDLPYADPKKNKKNKRRTGKRTQKPIEKLIENRPEEVDDRDTYGHWEMDTVYSSKDDKTCLLVLSERKTRTELVIQVADRTMKSIIKGLNWVERKLGAKKFREHFHTITCDNGVEFSDYANIEKSHINKKINRTLLYYCHPYSSFERGTNENINKMIRRFIPKGDDIGLYSKNEIKNIQDWINDYPRKILGGISSTDYKKYLGIEDITALL